MKLYLVRHGIAVDRLSGNIRTDFDRPLTPEGIDETEEVAEALKRLGVKPDLLVSSPLVRARQTAEIFGKKLDCREPIQISNSLQPSGDTTDLYKDLAKTKANEIMFFGHEPDIGELALRLIHAGNHSTLPFKKAGVCRIDVTQLPTSAPGTMKWMITPKIAKAIVR